MSSTDRRPWWDDARRHDLVDRLVGPHEAQCPAGSSCPAAACTCSTSPAAARSPRSGSSMLGLGHLTHLLPGRGA